MNDLRTAAQQALEALEEFGTHYGHCPRHPTWTRPELQPPCNCGLDSNVAALRAALAQEEPRRTGLPHCERSCEAQAFQIEIRRLTALLKEKNA